MTPSPQLQASVPSVNAAVRANAGSGKTWTLVARVARLLLRGARPDAILCVTYTKAAAAEMQTRLFERIGLWSILPDFDLRAQLDELDETPTDLAETRKLFARALETPGGLKIQTLHAFCEKLLRRFPLEAAVSPGFVVLDSAMATKLKRKAAAALARAALADPEGVIGKAYAHLAVQLDTRRFTKGLEGFIGRRKPLMRYLVQTGDLEGLRTDIWQQCGFHEGPSTEDELSAQALAQIDRALWREAARSLSAGNFSQTSKGFADGIMTALAADSRGDGHVDLFLSSVVTSTGSIHAHIGKSKELKREPALRERFLNHLDDVHAMAAQRSAAGIAQDTEAMLILAAAYVGLYQDEKAKQHSLDFDDQIGRALQLLTHADGAAAWVLFKLDGGIDHILLDEAQDTSPVQWDIIKALTDEFFAGSSARHRPRTLFFVGDEKQSIYSFQGAAPDRLLLESQAYSQRAEHSGAAFAQIDLSESYRSRPEILQFVDRLAELPSVARGLRPGEPLGSDIIRHFARRPEGGCVDLWPLTWSNPKSEQADDVWAPVDAPLRDSGDKVLARRIAVEVKALLGRDAVEDRIGRQIGLRPAEAGDILILVRKRSGLFTEILRALKQADIPVAGADRLKLADHIAFEDLLAFGRFCLLPEDDLTLAALLKSPLGGLSEEALFDLAYGRKGSLWAAVCASIEPVLTRVRALLDWALEAAVTMTPFDLFAGLLAREHPLGGSTLARCLAQLGDEARDVIEEVLNQILALEQQGLIDLESVIAALSLGDLEIKRELDPANGQVRVMTIHGAKGLEAPIVILPDTTGSAQAGAETLVLETADGGFLVSRRSQSGVPPAESARDWLKERAEQESLRLLYVAATRAKDRLILAGVARGTSKSGLTDGCWYGLFETVFDALDPPARQLSVAGGEPFRRLGADPRPAPDSRASEERLRPALPAWLQRPVAPEVSTAHLSPSALLVRDWGPSPSPLAQLGGLGRFRRGDLIHRLLQFLPDVLPSMRLTMAQRLLAAERDLSEAQRDEIAKACFGVLDDPLFAAVFGPGSRAEVAVAGTAAGLPVGISGRMDRLLVTSERVLVIDFKTNRPAPVRVEDAHPSYILQMAAYAALLGEVFPGRQIEAALVWTDGPQLMPVPEILMRNALNALQPAG